MCIHKTSIFIYKYHLVKKKKAKKKLRAKSHDLDREPVKPLTRTRETPTRKTWGRGIPYSQVSSVQVKTPAAGSCWWDYNPKLRRNVCNWSPAATA